MGRKKASPWRWRVAAILLLAALAGGLYAWWQARHWAPPRGEFPMQGVLIGARDGDVDFTALHAIGADFVYLEASRGAAGRDPAFIRNLAAVRESGLRFGALHVYDPCIPAERQSANFVTMVPRDKALLPPVVELSKLAEGCAVRVAEPAVESELTTFLNQIEGHAGQPAVLKIAPEFEERYGIADHIERNLWLTRDWSQPEYTERSWTLWTANSQLQTEASAEPVRWVALKP
ncbi:glycoside hydrolase family 25 protein [Altericroceibacterium xinjiangense]|uniref:glycoside hydrolase family 25 protein n=1 Tax=Altericroceibacterium xinjiangense TaxID=762261 RepID=UPI000F7F694B|nr:glycoside hydrolase family 25 protein [Altericroceibacterium xinjiangense]